MFDACVRYRPPSLLLLAPNLPVPPDQHRVFELVNASVPVASHGRPAAKDVPIIFDIDEVCYDAGEKFVPECGVQ